MQIKSGLLSKPQRGERGVVVLKLPGLQIIADGNTQFLGVIDSAQRLLDLAEPGDQVEADAGLRDVGEAVAYTLRVSAGDRHSGVVSQQVC